MELESYFEDIYSKYSEKVYKLALGMTGSSHDSEDITQEVFCRVYKSMNSFRKEADVYTWIYRITINLTIDHIKYRKKLPIYVLTEDLGYKMDEIINSNPINTPEMEVLSNEARRKCLHCLTECLQENQRKIFCLAITLDLPYKTVAEIMECSLGYVKGTLNRAKKKWLGYMENRCEYIKKSNPCKCSQWVKFGLENGWFKDQEMCKGNEDRIYIEVKNEIVKLRDLRDIYKELYKDKFSEELSKRIREGIKNKEWKNIL